MKIDCTLRYVCRHLTRHRPMRTSPLMWLGNHSGSDRGSAPVWALLCVSVLACTTWVALTLTEITLERLRLQTAADITALTATRDTCAAATPMVEQFGGHVVSCTASPTGNAVTVVVAKAAQIHVDRGVALVASARAGWRE